MQGKVGLEEHFAITDTINDSLGFLPERLWPEMRERLLDFNDQRLREMDKHGIEITVLSLNAPAVQAIPDATRANEIARRANDLLAEQVAKRPDRFAALAALPLQDPDLAIRELERCVNTLGFCGALANGFSQVGDANTALYYDLKRYWPFWDVVQQLDVPFYLHPRNPLPAWSQIYEGHPWLLGASWAFGVETATHALRLMGSGLFDEYPRLQIILGHMGEGLPYSMWRIDNHNAYLNMPNPCPAKKKMAEYFCSNFHLTTAGNFRTQSLIDAMLEIGVDRVLFSTDWPFEGMADAAIWFDSAAISGPDRIKIGRTNAMRLFKLERR
jgi:predicted TIM-barrel fold metal-dependent hydrolase